MYFSVLFSYPYLKIYNVISMWLAIKLSNKYIFLNLQNLIKIMIFLLTTIYNAIKTESIGKMVM